MAEKYLHLKLKLSDINIKMAEISCVENSQNVIHKYIYFLVSHQQKSKQMLTKLNILEIMTC